MYPPYTQFDRVRHHELVYSLGLATDVMEHVARDVCVGRCRLQSSMFGHRFSVISQPGECLDQGEGSIVHTCRSWLQTHEEAQIMLASVMVVVGLWWLVRTVLSLFINLVCPLLVVLLAVVLVAAIYWLLIACCLLKIKCGSHTNHREKTLVKMFTDLHWMPDFIHEKEEQTLHTLENWGKVGKTIHTESKEQFVAWREWWKELKKDTAEYWQTFKLWQTWGSVLIWFTWLYWLFSSALITRFMWQYYRYLNNADLSRAHRPSLASVLSLGSVHAAAVWTYRTWLGWMSWLFAWNFMNFVVWKSWMNSVAWFLWISAMVFMTWLHYKT